MKLRFFLSFFILSILLFSSFEAKALLFDTIIPPPVFKIDTMMRISYGSCYGNCPQYDLIIFNDGTAVWNGYKNISVGQHVTRLNRLQTLDLEKLAYNEVIWNGPEIFPSPKAFITDFPNRKLFIKNKDKVKNILVNHSPSTEIKRLEDKLRSIKDDVEWYSISN